MENSNSLHGFSLPDNKPSSPPATPGSARTRFPSTASHTSPSYNKRPAFPTLALSPPLDRLEQRRFNRSSRRGRQFPRDSPSRSSSVSGLAGVGEPGDSSPETDSPSQESDQQIPVQTQTVSEADFTIEELRDEDVGYNGDIEVIRPDSYEDTDSAEVDMDLSGRFGEMQCRDLEDEVEEQTRRYNQKKKRWSSGLFKRTYSQSLGSDTENEDAEAMDAHDVGSSARRLRRRIRGPGDRSSLVFEDNSNDNIVEIEEPEDAGVEIASPSLSLGTNGSTLEAMPFWVLEDPMEIDTEST